MTPNAYVERRAPERGPQTQQGGATLARVRSNVWLGFGAMEDLQVLRSETCVFGDA
jgi:hypothetical protein